VRLLAPDSLPRDYPEKELVIPQRITFKAQDGMTVRGQLFLPKQRSGQHPAVVYIHGGPPRQMLLGWHYMDYYSNDYALNQYLANRGYVVLAVNYRLGVGYGHEFQYPPNAGERGASEYRDVLAAGRYLQQLPNVDPKRVGLYGGSYGGYLTAMGLSHDSDVFAVGVDVHGVHNWTQDYGLDQLFVKKHYEVPVDAQRALDVAWESSPISAVAQWKSPVLFIHGDDDRNVKFAQTVDLVQRLSHTAVHYETLVLVDETHDIFRYENALKMNRATAEFLDRYLHPESGAH
jgi:dipeptidyl aminopeptidase/acylaminoacyl peptidase